MPVTSKAQLAAFAASRVAAVSDMTSRLGGMTPQPGQFTVTIRIDRPDGQFVTSYTQVPSDLLSRPEPDAAQEAVTGKISTGFVEAYRRAAELPD